MGSIVKKIKKTVGKVTGGLLGIDQKAPSAAQVEAPAPAVEVETAKVENVDTDEASTESNQKRPTGLRDSCRKLCAVHNSLIVP